VSVCAACTVLTVLHSSASLLSSHQNSSPCSSVRISCSLPPYRYSSSLGPVTIFPRMHRSLRLIVQHTDITDSQPTTATALYFSIQVHVTTAAHSLLLIKQIFPKINRHMAIEYNSFIQYRYSYVFRPIEVIFRLVVVIFKIYSIRFAFTAKISLDT
jgi:hypothetical protein